QLYSLSLHDALPIFFRLAPIVAKGFKFSGSPRPKQIKRHTHSVEAETCWLVRCRRHRTVITDQCPVGYQLPLPKARAGQQVQTRSEEHTSELQSREN